MSDNVTDSIKEVVTILDTPSQEAFLRATDQSLGKVAELTVKAVLGALTGGPAGAWTLFVSAFAQVFLEALTHTQHNLQKIEGAVSALVREPLMTGMEQLKLALKTAPSSEEATGYKLERMRMSLSSLDKAHSLALQGKLGVEVAFVDLLRGFCALELPGGMSEAKVHIDSFLKWACEQVADFFSLPSTLAEEDIIEKAKIISECELGKIHGTLAFSGNTLEGLYAAHYRRAWAIETHARLELLHRKRKKIQQDLLAASTETFLQKCKEIKDHLAEVGQLTAEKERLLDVVIRVSLLKTAIQESTK